MAIELIAELATNHGGDLDLAERMIDYAAAGGAHTVKTQAYCVESLNPKDPQYNWLVKSALSEADHQKLKTIAADCGLGYFASVFDSESAYFISNLCRRVKVASTEPVADWVPSGATVYKSHPWAVPPVSLYTIRHVNLVTVPLYPTPYEVLTRVEWGTGWSDHCVGLDACRYAVARGATTVEVHVSIPGEGRNCAWDKTQDDLKQLREWMETCQVIQTGVSKTFRERWQR